MDQAKFNDRVVLVKEDDSVFKGEPPKRQDERRYDERSRGDRYNDRSYSDRGRNQWR